MDTTAEDIYFDENGWCNYCADFLARMKGGVLGEGQKELALQDLIEKIKNDGRSKKYDCVIGLSGGADSSYVLHLAKHWGLRPLAVHMDNGWNSELAQNNIEHLVRKLEVDLYVHVIDWREYRKLMQAFFDADVIDVELLYDNAMLAVNYQLAAKYGVKYILSGCNLATEGMKIPKNWNWFKLDKRNIKVLAARGRVQIKSFPIIGLISYLYYRVFKKIQWVHVLDYVHYNKAESMSLLGRLYGFKSYPYKHYESVFTRFYQGYLLPQKFGVDKRKVHLSTLIMSGQMEREVALVKMKENPYDSIQALDQDREYFLKKMKWRSSDLDAYLQRPEVPHDHYASEASYVKQLKFLWKSLRGGG